MSEAYDVGSIKSLGLCVGLRMLCRRGHMYDTCKAANKRKEFACELQAVFR